MTDEVFFAADGVSFVTDEVSSAADEVASAAVGVGFRVEEVAALAGERHGWL